MLKNCSLEFVGALPANELIHQAIPGVSEREALKKRKTLGQTVYRFTVSDDHEERQIIKSKEEVKVFLDWYNRKFKESVRISSMGKFSAIRTIASAAGEKNSSEFMEMKCPDIFKYKVLNMKKIKSAPKWYQVLCVGCASKWQETDIIITEQGILEAIDGAVTGFFLFTSDFRFEYGLEGTKKQRGIILHSCHRRIEIQAQNQMDYISFLYFLRKALEQAKKKERRYMASAFVRKVNKINYLIDAQDYFREVFQGIQNARQEIFMCGWWISPELPLIRPINGDPYQYRLDKILQSKAKKGVLINVIVFNSPPLIPNDSKHTEATFRSLHPNIKVISHPSDIIPGLWTHHEKLVVIDQNTAFMGGLDLCYGRYDCSKHPVNSNCQKMYPGIQYNNNRIKDFFNVREYQIDGLARDLPRMPWHDVGFKVKGRVVADISNHFIEYWNNSLIEVFAMEEGENGEYLTYGLLDMIVSQKIEQEKTKELSLTKHVSMMAKRMSYNEPVVQLSKAPSLENNEAKNQQQQSRDQIPADIALLFELEKESLEKKSNARNLFNKFAKNINNKYNLLKKNVKTDYLTLSFRGLGIMKNDEGLWQKREKSDFIDECQLLRSASEWSIGLEGDFSECSIQNAYIESIRKAKTHIYIQNQFFISCTDPQESKVVKNLIAHQIFQRIKKAIEQKQKFRVIIIMPLLPGIEGQVDRNAPLALRLVLHWQYKTISRGGNSLYEKIAQLTPHPEEYIEFFGLRQHGMLMKTPVTEIIYVHTKLLIVDDEIVICGSANINDRSQMGDRDSQLCLIFSQGRKVTKKINGKEVEVNEKAHKLRVRLFKEHFGFIDSDICEDPLNKNLIEIIRQRAKDNTKTYRKLFGCYPDDQITTYQQIKESKKIPSQKQYQELSKAILGHAVQFPKDFLKNQKLSSIEPDILHKFVT